MESLLQFAGLYIIVGVAMAVIATGMFYSQCYATRRFGVGRFILWTALGPFVLALIVICAPIFLLLIPFGEYL